jgi:prevent-host-death family protein
VSTLELRNQADAVVDRAARGEPITITRAGQPVAELRPVAHPPLAGETFLAHWRRLPGLDPVALRADIGEGLDVGVPGPVPHRPARDRGSQLDPM